MPWKEVFVMSLRREFVQLANQEGANIRALCRRFGISPKTGYKWIARYAKEAESGLSDLSRRPLHSPQRTDKKMEARVIELRDAHPTWGGRKLQARLLALGHPGVPSASTLTAILRRHGRLDPQASEKHTAWQRFEHHAPNDLWQMDFKGHVVLQHGRCHPLTVLDDHSRYALCLQACADEKTLSVQAALIKTFRRYGLPARMTMDNGAPWGDDVLSPYTRLTVWLIRLGIGVSHSRPYHPQTQGKDERFHRTLKAELLACQSFLDNIAAQYHFDAWRTIYNLERPHEALAMNPPVSRYKPSQRAYPEILAPIEYGPGDEVRKVQINGEISYKGRTWKIGKAFIRQPVALRPAATDGVLNVYYCHQKIALLDTRDQK
jgi:transposase InsO family protein